MRYFILCALLSSILFSCEINKSLVAEIDRVMDKREAAFNNRHIEEYMAVFSEHYTDKYGDVNSLRKRMKSNFDIFETIEFTHKNRDVFVNNDTAKVVQDFNLAISIDGKSQGVGGTEVFNLKKEKNGWFIVSQG